ncbi:hypothetical protein ACWFRQ_10895 [Streptomyces niveus]
MNRDTTFERLLPRVRAVPPITADLLVAAGVALFTAADAAVNDPEYRQSDAFTWLLVGAGADLAARTPAARHRRPHGDGDDRAGRRGARRARHAAGDLQEGDAPGA